MLIIIKSFPLWVWAVFVYLMIVGIKSTRTRVVHLPTLFILPAILLLSKYSVLVSATFETIFVYLISILCGLGVGGVLGYKTQLQVLKAQKAIQLPGNYTTLILLMIFFVAKCIFGVLMSKDSSYFVYDLMISGALSGYFLGKSCGYVYRYKKDELGLPFEYQRFPQFFDAMCIQEDTDEKNQVIETILKTHDVQTVLDLTCGTGSQVFFLEKRGYKVIGADFSKDLLKIARSRALSEGIDVQFIDGDMRTLKVGHFDAVITIFNAVGHLTKSGFQQAMRNIYHNLNDQGIYVFDIFNLNAIVVNDLAMEVKKTVQGTQLHNTQYSKLNREKGHLTSYDTLTIKDELGEKTYKSEFTLQIYSAQELTEMLNKNGFEVLAQYDMKGEPFLDAQSSSILTVARKK